MIFFKKASYEPEFLGEAFPFLAKSDCQADCQSCKSFKSIHYFCKHCKMLENRLKSLKLRFSNIFLKLCIQQCCINLLPDEFECTERFLHWFCAGL